MLAAAGPVDFCDPDAFSAAIGGAGGAGGADPPILLIDDFEDGDRWSQPILGGLGHWLTSGLPPYPTGYPDPCPVPTQLVGEPEGRSWAMFALACGPEAPPQVALRMRSGAPQCTSPIDASAYAGVRFRARGNASFRFAVVTTAVTETAEDGTCEVACGDAFGVEIHPNSFWVPYEIPFPALSQTGVAAPAVFDPATILELRWTVQPYFELAIDDVAFYR